MSQFKYVLFVYYMHVDRAQRYYYVDGVLLTLTASFLWHGMKRRSLRLRFASFFKQLFSEIIFFIANKKLSFLKQALS
jgi:predicted membrane channel-forming protein YqfA (hemolysin III family)